MPRQSITDIEMYIPKHFLVEDRAEILRFMRMNPFAIIVSNDAGLPIATHMPVVVAREEPLTLWSHMALANPQWKTFDASREVLVIFQGSHAYISPAYYNTKQSVPTWNYTAVHAYGTPKVLTDDQLKLAVLSATFENTEPEAGQQWDEASDDYRQRMLGGMIAFEIAVTRLEGKYKLSQNRACDEQVRVAEGLSKQSDTLAAGVGNMMKRNLTEKKE